MDVISMCWDKEDYARADVTENINLTFTLPLEGRTIVIFHKNWDPVR